MTPRLVPYIKSLITIGTLLLCILNFHTTTAHAVTLNSHNMTYWTRSKHKVVVTKKTDVYKFKYTIPMSNMRVVATYELTPGMTFYVQYRGINFGWQTYGSFFHFTNNSNYGTGNSITTSWFKPYTHKNAQKSFSKTHTFNKIQFATTKSHAKIHIKHFYSKHVKAIAEGNLLLVTREGIMRNRHKWYLVSSITGTPLTGWLSAKNIDITK